MASRILATVIAIICFSYLMCLMIFFFMHQSIQEEVNQLNFQACEVVSTSGQLSARTLKYVEQSLQRYGSFQILLKLEKQLKPGVYDTFYDRKDIVDRPLRTGDRITLYCKDNRPTLFGRLLQVTLLGFQPRGDVPHIASLKTAVVAKNAGNLIWGHMVAAKLASIAETTHIAVKVVTIANPSGKMYGIASHREVDQDHWIYGDTADEIPGGINYISEYAEFVYEEESWPDTGDTLITYIQQ